jgi:hypothetical protein
MVINYTGKIATYIVLTTSAYGADEFAGGGGSNQESGGGGGCSGVEGEGCRGKNEPGKDGA